MEMGEKNFDWLEKDKLPKKQYTVAQRITTHIVGLLALWALITFANWANWFWGRRMMKIDCRDRVLYTDPQCKQNFSGYVIDKASEGKMYNIYNYRSGKFLWVEKKWIISVLEKGAVCDDDMNHIMRKQ